MTIPPFQVVLKTGYFSTWNLSTWVLTEGHWMRWNVKHSMRQEEFLFLQWTSTTVRETPHAQNVGEVWGYREESKTEFVRKRMSSQFQSFADHQHRKKSLRDPHSMRGSIDFDQLLLFALFSHETLLMIDISCSCSWAIWQCNLNQSVQIQNCEKLPLFTHLRFWSWAIAHQQNEKWQKSTISCHSWLLCDLESMPDRHIDQKSTSDRHNKPAEPWGKPFTLTQQVRGKWKDSLRQGFTTMTRQQSSLVLPLVLFAECRRKHSFLNWPHAAVPGQEPSECKVCICHWFIDWLWFFIIDVSLKPDLNEEKVCSFQECQWWLHCGSFEIWVLSNWQSSCTLLQCLCFFSPLGCCGHFHFKIFLGSLQAHFAWLRIFDFLFHNQILILSHPFFPIQRCPFCTIFQSAVEFQSKASCHTVLPWMLVLVFLWFCFSLISLFSLASSSSFCCFLSWGCFTLSWRPPRIASFDF